MVRVTLVSKRESFDFYVQSKYLNKTMLCWIAQHLYIEIAIVPASRVRGSHRDIFW